MSPSYGLYVPPFGELSDPRRLADLAAHAEERGWEAMFLWDHLLWDGVRAVADPWVALSAMAFATSRIRIGPMVTPLPRRRVPKVARETVSLDVLSGGRLIFGAGLGADRGGELSRFGEELDGRARARLLDDGLELLEGLWSGDLFEPPPVQQPRIPVWLGVRWPNRRPLPRAARWDGVFPVEVPEPGALEHLVAEVLALRDPSAGPYDVAVTQRPGTDPAPWVAAGATWFLHGFGPHVREAEVRAAVDAGPPR
jgi:alkanesulfonate monooxygenase SsuD/methylene tetrahydromethanopterin reductase-like flavin-dependent oxidoreductase (luciferase family)